MRRVLIVIEEVVDGVIYTAQGSISLELLEGLSHPEDVLLAEYHIAAKAVSAKINYARIAGPAGKLP